LQLLQIENFKNAAAAGILHDMDKSYYRQNSMTFFPVRICRRRNGYYYAHVTVPHIIRHSLQRVQIKKSLRTKNHSEAQFLRAGVENSLKYLLSLIYQNPDGFISQDEISHYLKDLASDLSFMQKERNSQLSS